MVNKFHSKFVMDLQSCSCLLITHSMLGFRNSEREGERAAKPA